MHNPLSKAFQRCQKCNDGAHDFGGLKCDHKTKHANCHIIFLSFKWYPQGW